MRSSSPNTPAKKRNRLDRGRTGIAPSSLDGVAAAHANDDSVDHAPAADRIVVLNVGGTIVTTLESTLRVCSSHFTEWLDNDFHGFPRDKQGRPFLDRDANNLRHILNYMRGYGLPSKADDVVLLAEDAVFFDIPALKEEIGLTSSPVWRFTPGPGVNDNGTQFSTADILALCGMRPLTPRHTHTVGFRIDKCELISIGLIAIDHARTDQQLFRQRQSVSYSSTGEIVRFWGDEPLYDSGTPFKASDLITVQVQLLHPPCPNSSLPLPLTTGPSRAPFLDIASSSFSITTVIERNSPSRGNLQTEDADALFSENRLHGSRNDATSTDSLEANLAHAERSSPASPSEWPSNNLIGAIIIFKIRSKDTFEVRWPAPVPPLQFAVSMQGSSSVSIINSKTHSNPTNELAECESIRPSSRLGLDTHTILEEGTATPLP
ncbi:unnamed protein product [Phytomonas sp. EM1]|nr:unnamed protein product [Phytomonas sp. EM1]|eukprot:CCW62401.1 unnamed protein product [Phytomonas sp. isolate EM1]